MGRRRRAREYAVQILFQLDLAQEEVDRALVRFWEGRGAPPDLRAFTEELVRGTMARRDELDRMLQGASENWRVERMPVVDRNILRLALFELQHHAQAPPAVILDEAIEIAKRYGDVDSGPFVNGVLDAVRRGLERGEGAHPEGHPLGRPTGSD